MPFTAIAMTTPLVLMFLVLLVPVTITPLVPPGTHPKWLQVKTAVVLALVISLFPLFIFLHQGTEAVIVHWNWMNTASFDVSVSLKFDLYSLVFTPVALYVTWSILSFASWYMHSDPHMDRFFNFLLIFLIAMIILATSNNMFQRLAWGSIVAGLIITTNINLPKTPVMTMPLPLKLMALLVTVLGFIIALEMAQTTNKQIKTLPKTFLYNFSAQLGFFPVISHRISPHASLAVGHTVAIRTTDQGWLETLGPQGLHSVNIPLVTTTSDAQRGMVKTFFTTFFLTLVLAVFLMPYTAR